MKPAKKRFPRASGWSHYLSLKHAMTCFFLGCLFMALAEWPLPNGRYGEVFPFSSFNMFCSVVSRKKDVALWLTEVDGKPVLDPQNFQNTISNDAYYMLARIGRGKSIYEAHRQLFETMHLSKYYTKTLKYEVILRDYDTLDYYRTGRYQYQKVQEYEITKDAQIR